MSLERFPLPVPEPLAGAGPITSKFHPVSGDKIELKGLQAFYAPGPEIPEGFLLFVKLLRADASCCKRIDDKTIQRAQLGICVNDLIHTRVGITGTFV